MTTHGVVERQVGKHNTKHIAFCIIILYLLDIKNIKDVTLEFFCIVLLHGPRKRYKYMLIAISQRFWKRNNWEELENSLMENQFQRYFWLSLDHFSDLCQRIEDNTGPIEFKQETFIHELEKKQWEKTWRQFLDDSYSPPFMSSPTSWRWTNHLYASIWRSLLFINSIQVTQLILNKICLKTLWALRLSLSMLCYIMHYYLCGNEAWE